MTSKVAWLRASYWAGAVADLGIGVLTLVPSRMGETEYRYPMGLAATLLFGWALLLIWADRRPLERRGVLPPTIFVIVGLLAAGVFAAASGIFPIARIIPTSILGAALIALMGFSYVNARGIEETSA
jgi:drug/metabolite transporter (DMT)-like permease